ncbi:MAG: ROK family glucokinase [Ornithinimicrobium sp.]|uniref:ROK family glucokinase n=1 Tax=Ornithinimicrobium sp. TaxID=1977084 RepID=UPI003D9B8878
MSRAAGAPPAVGVDIGGTTVWAGAVEESGRVLAQVHRATPGRSTRPEVVEDVIVSAVREVLLDARLTPDQVVGVGVGAAGFVSADRRTVLFAPHLSWRDEPLRDRLSRRLSLPVTIENDANAAAWAEHRFGAGQGESRLLLVTLGTGIGGGLVLDGRVERGRHGLCGEFGHMVMVPEGRRCECGNRGCWEQYASGSVVLREARELVRAGGPYAAELARRCGGLPEDLDGPAVTAAAHAGDAAAQEVLAEVGRWLGLGLANLVAALDPGCVVVGGGVSAADDLVLGPARQTLARHLTGRGHRPVAPVRAAYLGPSAGLIGAADLARIEQTPQV